MTDLQPGTQIIVMIPEPLRRYAGGRAEVCLRPGTVAEILYQLVEQHRDIGSHLIDENGRLQHGVTIAVDGRDIRFASQLQTPVPAGKSMQIVVTLLV